MARDCTGNSDVRIRDGRVVDIGTLEVEGGETIFEADGGALLPSLADHHVHLFALAARMASTTCGPPEVNTEHELIEILNAEPFQAEWLRGVGYHESVAELIDRRWLDKHGPDRPIRIQHRSGRLWVLNSLGIDELGERCNGNFPDGMNQDSGHLFDEDAWLRTMTGNRPPDLSKVSQSLASYGVSAVTDMTPQNDRQTAEIFMQQQMQGRLHQRVLMAGTLSLAFEGSMEEEAVDRLRVGPFKIHLHEAQLPEFDELCDAIRESHRGQRPIAVHCVTEIELVFTLAALRETGTLRGDRIEHASVAPPALLEQIKALGLLVVTQPNFVFERGDQYLEDVDTRDLSSLYRCDSFVKSGIALAGGTDAPFGRPDPWLAINAAVNRKTRKGQIINSEEALSPEQAIEMFLGDVESPGEPRLIAIGKPADLCLLDCNWQTARTALTSNRVRATWCGGKLIFNRVD